MEENKDINEKTTKKTVISSPRTFLLDMVRGMGMGIAFIIPGFSGGSIAAILGIYEKLIGAIADIFKSFKKSFTTLLPIFLGLVIGAVSLLFPLEWALGSFPLPTVSLFVGLAIGGLPSVTDKVRGKIKLTNIIAFIIPLIFTVLLSFAPTGADVDLYSLSFGGYLLLFGIGIIASAALVVPGISGSMMMLVFGYYNPIIKMITGLIKSARDLVTGGEVSGSQFSTPLLVLGSCGLGIVVGFIGISMIMKILLEKCKRGTYFAIIGFIVGSIPPVFVSAAKDAGYTHDTLPTSPLHWIMCVLLLLLGFTAAFLFVRYAKRLSKQN